MHSLDQFAAAKLNDLDVKQLRRRLQNDHRVDGVHVERDGRRLISFSCNDYLGLSHDPRVKRAAAEAVLEFGAGAGASRLITGNHPPLRDLEAALARFKKTEAACVFGSGYLANSGITPCLVKRGDVVFIDELAHSCLWAGARLSEAEVRTFAHNNVADLARQLSAHRKRFGRALVLTDGVFSMDGDLAPVDQLTPLCVEHDAWFMVDDAHGLGVVGGGRGAAHAFPGAEPPLQMGTLSKAAGSYGGYLCASEAVIDLIKTRSRTFIYSTGLPPASAAAALTALAIIESEPDLVAKPLALAQRFTRALNLPTAESAVVPIVIGDAGRALEAARALEQQGFLVVPIRPPTVPPNTARLRFAFSALHSEGDVDAVAGAVRALM